MKKLIIMACTMAMMLAAPIAANAGTVYLGNISAGSPVNGRYTFPGAKNGYFTCDNNVQQTAGCQTTYIAVTTASGSGDTGGTQSNPTYLGTCTFSSCVCDYSQYLSGNKCVDCSSQPNRTNTVATSDKSYHTKTSCDTCLPTMVGMAPAAGVIICYCPDNGTCSGGSVTCNKGYYRTGSGGASQYSCQACESGATTDSAGATSHSACCYPAGYGQGDSSGYWRYTSKCCYSN